MVVFFIYSNTNAQANQIQNTSKQCTIKSRATEIVR